MQQTREQRDEERESRQKNVPRETPWWQGQLEGQALEAVVGSDRLLEGVVNLPLPAEILHTMLPLQEDFSEAARDVELRPWDQALTIAESLRAGPVCVLLRWGMQKGGFSVYCARVLKGVEMCVVRDGRQQTEVVTVPAQPPALPFALAVTIRAKGKFGRLHLGPCLFVKVGQATFFASTNSDVSSPATAWGEVSAHTRQTSSKWKKARVGTGTDQMCYSFSAECVDGSVKK
mmetsp:Transcript_33266/g.85276  ORF Transcript_33266/g.85276 Transcript_33266/m.85276 type:complete len:232 (-) Transcript_33266:58-753(-)